MLASLATFKGGSRLKKLLGKGKRSVPKQEWIAVHFSLASGEFGSSSERELVQQFAHKIAEAIHQSGLGVYDGDEFGEGTGGLFMYGADANKLIDLLEPLFRDWKTLKGGYVVKRYGADDIERVQF